MTASSRFDVLAAARVLWLIAIACLLLFLHTAAPPVRASGSTFVVNRTDDSGSSGCIDPKKNDCSLRGAIEKANASGTFNNIRFAKKIDWATHPIVLSASLPAIISQGTWIDGRDEAGAFVYPVVNANGVGGAFLIAASDVTISNLSVYGAPASAADIHIQAVPLGLATIDNIQIAYNWIGAPRNRTSCVALSSANNAGVRVDADAFSGVAAYIYGNVVVCHGGPGIDVVQGSAIPLITQPSGIAASPTTAITVSSNLVGTDGSLALPNQLTGILIEDVTAGQIPLLGNVVSGNGAAGVWIKNSAGVTLRGNYIGLNATGLSAIPNGADGVAITAGSNRNIVGGPTSAERNFIGGNAFSGVFLGDAGTISNTVASNLIGLNATGSAAVPNGYAGIAVIGADNNTLGSGGAGLQFISGNTREGIYVANASNLIVDSSNFVGVAANQTGALGDGLEGIKLDTGTHAARIGPALVANNGGVGLGVLGTATSNQLVPLAVRANGGLPIDLGEDGATPNDPGDGDNGPNALLNYPVIIAANGSSLSGTACANCTVHIYQAVGNPAAPGGGGTHVASTPADGAGNWSTTLPNGLTRKDVSLLAVAPTGDTSEMSPHPLDTLLYLPLIRR